jgi:hypothetical protein
MWAEYSSACDKKYSIKRRSFQIFIIRTSSKKGGYLQKEIERDREGHPCTVKTKQNDPGIQTIINQ